MVAHTRKDFFISYNKADRAWAEWIAWELEEEGYSTVLQAWDFRPGNNFVLSMQHSAAEADRTLIVLSPDFLTSLYCQPEWAAAFAGDPTGSGGKLVPVRVRDCQPEGLLAQINYIDFLHLNEAEAREALRGGVGRGRLKPSVPPSFPGSVGRSHPPPHFPGHASNSLVHLSPATIVHARRRKPGLWKKIVLMVLGTGLLVALFVILRTDELRRRLLSGGSLDADLGLVTDAPLPHERTRFDLVPELSWLTSAVWAPGGHGLILLGDIPAQFYLYSVDGRRVPFSAIASANVNKLQAPAYIAGSGSGYFLKSKDTRLFMLDEKLQIQADYDLQATSNSTDDVHLVGVKDWTVVGQDVVAISDMAQGDLEDREQCKYMTWLTRCPLLSPARISKVDEIVRYQPLPHVYRMGYPHIAALGKTAYFLKMHGTSAPSLLSVLDANWLQPGNSHHIGLGDFQTLPSSSVKDRMEAYKSFESASVVAAVYAWREHLYLLLKCSTQDSQPTRWFLTKVDPGSMNALHTISVPADSPHLTVMPGDSLWAFIEKSKLSKLSSGQQEQIVSHLIVVPASEIESADSPLAVRQSPPSCSDGAHWNPDHLIWESRSGL
jgi:hypothetical protein